MPAHIQKMRCSKQNTKIKNRLKVNPLSSVSQSFCVWEKKRLLGMQCLRMYSAVCMCVFALCLV